MGIKGPDGKSINGMPSSPIFPDKNGYTGKSYQLEPVAGENNGGFIIVKTHVIRPGMKGKGRSGMEISRIRIPLAPGESQEVPWHGRVEGF